MARTFPSILVLALLFGPSVLSAASRRDRIPPTAPTNLAVTATTEHSASLAWDPSTDNSGRFHYIIRGGESTVTVGQETTSHTLEDLQPGKTYTFRVYAKDAAGNLSDPSNPVTVTLPGDLGAPTKPVVGTLEVGPTHASLNWSSTDDGPFIWYTIYIDGEPVATLSSRSDTFTCAEVLVPTGCIPVDQETTYTFTVDARDADGNFSPPSDPVFVTTHPAPDDRTAPEPPANVAADFNGHIVVTWDPATDDLAPQRFIRYDVYVNGELRGVVVGTARAEVEADVGVNEIEVVAVDTADNESAPGTATFNL